MRRSGSRVSGVGSRVIVRPLWSTLVGLVLVPAGRRRARSATSRFVVYRFRRFPPIADTHTDSHAHPSTPPKHYAIMRCTSSRIGSRNPGMLFHTHGRRESGERTPRHGHPSRRPCHTAKPHSHGPENYLFTAMKSHRHCPSLAQRARAQRALLLGDTLMRD